MKKILVLGGGSISAVKLAAILVLANFSGVVVASDTDNKTENILDLDEILLSYNKIPDIVDIKQLDPYVLSDLVIAKNSYDLYDKNHKLVIAKIQPKKSTQQSQVRKILPHATVDKIQEEDEEPSCSFYSLFFKK